MERLNFSNGQGGRSDIKEKCGNALISTLRHRFGSDFAPGASPNAKLSHVINVLDDQSLVKLLESEH